MLLLAKSREIYIYTRPGGVNIREIALSHEEVEGESASRRGRLRRKRALCLHRKARH